MTPPDELKPPAAANGPVHLHIERLVVDGLPLEPRQAQLLQAAVENELVRLFAQQGYPGGAASSGAVAALPAAVVTWQGKSAALLGKQVAGSIYRSLRT